MPLIKVEDIAHVRFAAPDLQKMADFLTDFGLSCFTDRGRLYGRAQDGRPFVHVTEPGESRFLGLGLRASALEDLHRLAEAEAVSVEDLEEPGGGLIVRLVDPDGYQVEVVAGQACDEATEPPVDALRNTARLRARFRAPVRLKAGPSHVLRIGHAVLKVRDFRASEAWYKQKFGFLTSDEIHVAQDTPMGGFLRCDRGDLPADHHTLFLAQAPGKPGLLHAAFEVANLDDLMLGRRHLEARGHRAAWGVGRHILGSQIFDYWQDPFGNEVEHWTDGDLLTAADPPQTSPMSALLAVHWGAPHPGVPPQ